MNQNKPLDNLRGLKFGDKLVNGWAGEGNPHKVGIFVRRGKRTGRLNPGPYFVMTDGKGDFWEANAGPEHKLTRYVEPAPIEQDDELRKTLLVSVGSRLMKGDNAGQIVDGVLRIIRSQPSEANIERVKHLARIEAMEWALSDFLMPDTDTEKNIQGYIDEEREQLTTASKDKTV